MPRMSILTVNEKEALESPPDRSLPGSTSTCTASTISRPRSCKIRSVWRCPQSVSSRWVETGSMDFGATARGNKGECAPKTGQISSKIENRPIGAFQVHELLELDRRTIAD